MNRALMQIKALDRFVFRISEWKKLSSAERDDATRFSHVLAGKEEGAIMRTIALLLVTVLLSAGALALHPENTLAYGGGGFGRGAWPPQPPCARSSASATLAHVHGEPFAAEPPFLAARPR
jgi:hypothetical protein